MTQFASDMTTDIALVHHHPRALRKGEYEDRSCHHSGAKVHPLPSGSLNDCPKCLGAVRESVSRAVWVCRCFNGFIVTRELARQPTSFGPGTPEKVAILAARNEYGFRWDGSLDHPLDSREQMPGRLVEIVTNHTFWDGLMESEEDDSEEE